MKPKTELCVPYLDEDLIIDGQPNEKYLLYTLTFDDETDSNWGVRGAEEDETAAKRIRDLQEYFKKRHYNNSCPGVFEIKSLNTFSADDDEENANEYVTEVNNQTTSVFLGIFLRATEQIQRREFKDKWQIICATGDLKYDEMNGKLNLVPVEDIVIDKDGTKYSGEFLELAKAEENKHEKFLFLSIGDKEEPEKEYGNITVKQFSPDNTVDDVLNYVFKPFSLVFNYKDLDAMQKKLMGNMETEHGVDYGYIPGTNFHELERIMLNDAGWRGFFIYGEGGSGKSATAMTIARYMVWLGKIYAPLWIKVDNDKITGLIEKESTESMNSIMERAAHNEIETYISSRLRSQISSNMNSLEKELSEKQYLIIIDNLELSESNAVRVLTAVQKILANLDNKPYLMVTSRVKCDDSMVTGRLHLRAERASKLNEEQVALFIKNIADNNGTMYANKIKAAEENNSFKKLVELLFQKFGDFPNLIITAVGLLEYMTVAELCGELGTSFGGNEEKIRDKRIKIYQVIFSYLNTIQKQALYFFLEIGEDKSFSIDEIYKKIHESKPWGEAPLGKSELIGILRVLVRHNLIYSTENEDKTVYGIKSIAYHTLLFEKEFLGPQLESGEYLRDKFVDLGLQLKKALRYDQGTEVIKPILEKMKAKSDAIIREHLFTAAQYSKNPEVLSLLKDHGCILNVCDDDGSSAFYYAVNGNNIVALDWLFEYESELLNHTDKYEKTIFYSAAESSKTAILDWLWARVPDLLTKKHVGGMTPFHLAAVRGNIAALDWLLIHSPELLNSKMYGSNITAFHGTSVNPNNDKSIFDWFYHHAPELLGCSTIGGHTFVHHAAIYNNIAAMDWLLTCKPELFTVRADDGATVFHSAARHSNIITLDWLFEHVPELITCTNNEGATVFRYATTNSDIAVLNWFFKHVPELLGNVSDDGSTVFHYAAALSNASVLDWFFKHIPELLTSKTNYGETVFHSAACNKNTAILDWLFEHVPELLNQVDDGGKTIFHYAAENSDSATLDWFFKHIPELLTSKTNYGGTVFHSAAYNKNTAILDWLFEHVPDLLVYKTNDGDTVFHYAAGNSDAAVLDWFFKHVPDLLNCTDNDGWTVFHFAAGWSNTTTLDWFFEHTPELLNQITNDGGTVFHYAVANSDTTVLDWFFKHIPELLNRVCNEGMNVFHQAAREKNTAVLDWLFEHVPELLNQMANNGENVFHYAAANSDAAVLDWFFKRIPELLNRTDNDGKTALDHAKEKNNTIVLDWLSKNAPELIKPE